MEMKPIKKTFFVLFFCLIFCLFAILSIWKNSKANNLDINEPIIDENGLVTWDCIYFGNYWQDDTNDDGVATCDDEKTPIKWRILSVNGNDAFILSEKNLLYMLSFDGTNWENCNIRKELNENFYNEAFSDLEKTAILTSFVENIDNPDILTGTSEPETNTYDKIYLLSLSEVLNAKYGFNIGYGHTQTRVSNNTDFVYNMQSDIQGIKQTSWFLRNQGKFGANKLVVDNIGGIGNLSIGTDHGRIRPCMHIDLSNAVWTKADEVYAETGEIEATSTPTATPTPTPTVKPTPTVAPTVTPTQTPSNTQTPGVDNKTTQQPTNNKSISPTSTPVTAPSKPTKLSAKNNKKKTVTLTWKKVKGAKGYQVQYAYNEPFSKKTKTTTKTKLVVKSLKKKKTYSFRVRAYKLDGKKKVYGKWSTVKKVKIKK